MLITISNHQSLRQTFSYWPISLVVLLVISISCITSHEIRVFAFPSTEVVTLVEKGDSYIASGNLSGALEYFDRALSVDPTDTKAMTDKGLALGRLGRSQEAITYFD